MAMGGRSGPIGGRSRAAAVTKAVVGHSSVVSPAWEAAHGLVCSQTRLEVASWLPVRQQQHDSAAARNK